MRVKKKSNSRVSINGQICYLGQKPWLINGSIKDNILLQKSYDQEKLDIAIKYSCLDDDLKTFDDGIDHLIGEDGNVVSGGQKARIGLARCIYQE